MVSSYLRSGFGRSAPPRTLAQRAVAYQSGGQTVVGGIPQGEWSEETNVSGGTTGRTFVNPGAGVQFPTRITKVNLHLHDVGGDTNDFRAKLWRYNGATWDMLAEQAFTGDSTRKLTEVTLSPAWRAQPGDVLGAYLGVQPRKIYASQLRELGIQFSTGDLTGAAVAFGSSLTQEIHIEAVGDRPYVASISDSIMGGTNKWWTPLDNNTPVGTIPGGDPNYNWCSYLPDGVSGASMGRGSTTFAWAVSTGWAAAAALDPHTVILHFGPNDIAAARTWEDVEADLNSLKALWDASDVTRLAVVEILPWTAGSDGRAATVRAWNTNLATWCSANGATLIEAHDAMGQTRASTGELDDLKAAYNDGDGIHVNQAGSAALANLIAAAL